MAGGNAEGLSAVTSPILWWGANHTQKFTQGVIQCHRAGREMFYKE